MKKWNVFGILTLLVIGMVFMNGCTRPVSMATTPEPSPKSQIVNETGPQQVTTPSVIIPPTGFWVKVTYSGTFSGNVGKPGFLKEVEDSGDHFYQISTADGPVWVSIQKSDGSSAELAVDVYKDGTLIRHAATTAPNGVVEFEASAKTVTRLRTAIPTIPTPTPTPTLTPTTTVSSSVETEYGSLSIHTGGFGKGVSVFIAPYRAPVPPIYYDSYGNVAGVSELIRVEILPDGNSEMVWLPVGQYTAYLPNKDGKGTETHSFLISANSNTLISFEGYSYRTS
jgi:hypothetical protein